MRSAAFLMLLPLAACASGAETTGSGSSVATPPSTASMSVARQCEATGFMPGTEEYQRCYNAGVRRQNSAAGGAMNLYRTIEPMHPR